MKFHEISFHVKFQGLAPHSVPPTHYPAVTAHTGGMPLGVAACCAKRRGSASAAARLLSHGRGFLEDDPRVVLGLVAAAVLVETSPGRHEGQDGPLLDSATGGEKRDAERFHETGMKGGEIS